MSDEIFNHLTRKKFIEAMEATEYGWRASGEYKHIGCPSDLEFISEQDEPYKGRCFMDCKHCWEYVLKTKWK